MLANSIANEYVGKKGAFPKAKLVDSRIYLTTYIEANLQNSPRLRNDQHDEKKWKAFTKELHSSEIHYKSMKQTEGNSFLKQFHLC